MDRHPFTLRSEIALTSLFLAVDIGFILYWTTTALHLLPPEWLYKDYRDPILVAWNWSFLPLDLAVSGTGLTTVVLRRRGFSGWTRWATASLALTTATGFQAISFWAIRGDFDPAWWTPNLFLLLYPWFFLAGILRSRPDRQA